MNIQDYSSGIYRDLGSPTSLSQLWVSGWLVDDSNVGSLNILINVNYTGISGDITGGFYDNSSAQAVYKQLFTVTYLERELSKNLEAAGIAIGVASVTDEDGRSVRFVTKTDNAKIISSSLKDARSNLDTMAMVYRRNGCVPYQVINTGEAYKVDYTIQNNLRSSL